MVAVVITTVSIAVAVPALLALAQPARTPTDRSMLAVTRRHLERAAAEERLHAQVMDAIHEVGERFQ